MENSLKKFVDILVESCDPPRKSLSMDEVLSFEISRRDILDRVISVGRRDFGICNWNRNLGFVAVADASRPVGLNTIGMLVDRLSILVIKKKIIGPGSGAELDLQIDEMVCAVDCCQKGFSSAFNKVTSFQQDDSPCHVVDIVLHLAFVNLLLWLSQDVLYLRGAGSLPNEELRAYIDYFSKKNILRNQLISSLAFYWHR